MTLYQSIHPRGLIFAGFFYISIIQIFLSGCASPERETSGYISLSPAVTEILFEIGAGEMLTARTDYCDWPSEALEKPSVGSFTHPSIERIVSLRPGIVFSAGGPQEEVTGILSRLGVEVEVVNPSSLDELYESIIRVGELTGRGPSALALAERLKGEISGFSEKSFPGSPVRVYAEISDSPVMGAGGVSYINDMIERAGGVNVAGDVKRDYFVSGYEFILERNPEVILLFSSEAERKKNLERRLSGRVEAAGGRIYLIDDEDVFMRPGPRVAEGIRRLKEVFYGTPGEEKLK